MNSALDPIFNSYKIKFASLDTMMQLHDIKIKKNQTVNVFINLDSLIRSLTSNNICDVINSSDDNDFKRQLRNCISNILNLAAHYRRYFTTRQRYSRVYIYASYPFVDLNTSNNVFISDYRKNYYANINKPSAHSLKNILTESFKMGKIISEYIEEVYLITANNMETSLIPKIIKQEFQQSDDFNIIVTKDTYEYQYVLDDYVILRPKIQDMSYAINKDNLIETIKFENKVKSKETVDASFYPFICTIMGDKNRSIHKLSGLGISKIIKLINKSIEKGLISETNNDVYSFSRLIDVKNQRLFLNNFNVIDLESQMKFLSIKDKMNVKVCIRDRFDNLGLAKINDDLFKDCPINVEDLTEGLKFKYSQVSNPFNQNNVFF